MPCFTLKVGTGTWHKSEGKRSKENSANADNACFFINNAGMLVTLRDCEHDIMNKYDKRKRQAHTRGPVVEYCHF
jgi:hypothetical protein